VVARTAIKYALVALLLGGCSAEQRFSATVRFPDELARSLAQQLWVMTIVPAEGAGCPALVDGSAAAGDAGYEEESRVEVPLDESVKGQALKVPGKGERLFYAEAKGEGGRVYLRGCTPVEVGAKESRVVIIDLEWVEKACQTVADCDDQNSCTTDLCEDQLCIWETLEDGAGCDDQDVCTVGDACDAGQCVPGSRAKDSDSDSYVDQACGGDDCDDNDDQVQPGLTEDTATALLCQDGKDNDCDGLTDGDDVTCPPYFRTITIDAARVAGTADLDDFPVLIAVGGDPLLASLANGGHVAHDAGEDILFLDSDGTTLLDFEIEEYDPVGGSLTAWVRVPVLSASADTILILQYGDPAVDVSLANPPGVWDAGYVAVFHLNQDPSGPAPQFTDSTANGFHGTNEGGLVPDDLDPGKIGKCMVFQHDLDDWISVPMELKATGDQVTVEAWMYSPDWAVSLDAPAINTGGLVNTERFFVGVDRTAIQCIRVTTDVQHYRYDQGPIPVDEWAHLVTRYDGVALKGYVNGVEVQTWDASGAILDTDAPGRIGARFDDRRLYGALDEIRVSDIARPVEWIQTGYNNQDSPDTFYSVGSEF
jgi:hypothetical protein